MATEPMIHTYILDLPFPPSVNSIWRKVGNKMVISAPYHAWKIDANRLGLAQRINKNPMMVGPFEADILLDSAKFGKIDVDNPSKAVLDWTQKMMLVENDKNCRRLLIEWGDTSHGCKLTLRGRITLSTS